MHLRGPLGPRPGTTDPHPPRVRSAVRLRDARREARPCLRHAPGIRRDPAPPTPRRGWPPDLAVNQLPSGDIILINAHLAASRAALTPEEIPDGSQDSVEDEIAYIALSAGAAATCASRRWRPTSTACGKKCPTCEAHGHLVRHLWELVEHNGDEIARDAWLAAPQLPRDDSGISLVGPSDRLSIPSLAKIEPFVVADCTGGPVIIDRDAVTSSARSWRGRARRPGAACSGRSYGASSAGAEVPGRRRGRGQRHPGTQRRVPRRLPRPRLRRRSGTPAQGTGERDLATTTAKSASPSAASAVHTGRTGKSACFLGDHTGPGHPVEHGHIGQPCSPHRPGGLLPKYVPSFASVSHGAIVDNSDLRSALRPARRSSGERDKTLTDTRRSTAPSTNRPSASVARRSARPSRTAAPRCLTHAACSPSSIAPSPRTAQSVAKLAEVTLINGAAGASAHLLQPPRPPRAGHFVALEAVADRLPGSRPTRSRGVPDRWPRCRCAGVPRNSRRSLDLASLTPPASPPASLNLPRRDSAC